MGTTVTRGHFATSADGLSWDRPSLGLHEWNGSKDNNLAREPGKIGLTHILRDEREPDPARTYKGMFGGGHREFGVSPDGFDWTMLDVPGIPSEDTSYMLYDEYTEQFLAYHKPQHRVGPVRLAGEVHRVRRLVGVGPRLPQ